MQRHLDESRTAKGVLNESHALRCRCRTGETITRLRVEAPIECWIVVRSVKARVVEQVEKVRLVFQLKPLVDFEVLHSGKIESGLEGAPESIAARASKAGFEVVADYGASRRSRIWVDGSPACRYAALPGRQQRY